MKAFLKNHRQAPRKVRLIADSVRGKRVSDAVAGLSFMPHKAAEPLKKLILSAFANVRQKDEAAKEEDFIISHISVDKGFTFTRYMPRAFGRASPINRESSHIRVELSRVDGAAVSHVEEKPAVSQADKKKKGAETPKSDETKEQEETKAPEESNKKEPVTAAV